MKRLLIGAALFLVALTAGADVVFGPQTFTIPRNTFTTAARVVPARVTALTVKLSRENWPTGGLDIELLVSFDGGTVYESPGPSHIDPFVPTPKEPDVLLSPASIGVGWNQDVRQATHVKARTVNPSPGFQSTVTIEALVVPQ